MFKIRTALAALSVLACSATAAHAAPAGNSNDYLTGSVGWYDMNKKVNEAALFGLEYRAHDLFYGFRPTVGAFVTTDSSLYGYGGFEWDVALLPNQLYLIPSFTVGAWKRGSGKDLGGTIEFRSGIELDYQFVNQHRIGLVFNHISNASIYSHNPGVETLLLNYSIPFNSVWHY
jgi:lipid A 3-O-deacylase